MNKILSPYHGFRCPGEVISHAVWLYHRFTLSFRNVEEILVSRGVDVTYEWRAVDQDGEVLDILVQRRRMPKQQRSFFASYSKGRATHLGLWLRTS